MSSERSCGCSGSEQRADRLAVGAHPRPLPGGPRLQVCTGRRPLPLGWPPTRAGLTLVRVRSPSGTSIRQGARRQCARDNLFAAWIAFPHAPVGLSSRCPSVPSAPHAVVPSLLYPEWQDEGCGSSQRLCGDASSPRNPDDGWTEKEKKETEHGWSCGQGFPGVGCRGRLSKPS